MVDASALTDYEFALFFSAVFAEAFVGFLVAYFHETTAPNLYRTVAIIFGLCSAGFFGWAVHKRRTMTAQTKSFRLKTSGVEEVKTLS